MHFSSLFILSALADLIVLLGSVEVSLSCHLIKLIIIV